VSKRKLSKSKNLIKRLEGGMANSLPNGAVEFTGRTHEEGGIILPDSFFGEKESGGPLTEVEDKETMDRVNGEDYFFSSHLTLGDKTFAERHKQLLYAGGSRIDIEELARIQEIVAGRDKYELGGERIAYMHGGAHDKPYYTTSHDPEGARKDSVVYYYIDPNEVLNNATFTTQKEMETHMTTKAKENKQSLSQYKKVIPYTPNKRDTSNEENKIIENETPFVEPVIKQIEEPIKNIEENNLSGNIFIDGNSNSEGQGGLKYGDRTIYLNDPNLISQIEDLGGFDNFMDSWWESADKSVLTDANLESIDDLFANPFTDARGRVTYPGWESYQTSYNKVLARDDVDKQILVDGLPGNQSFSSGFDSAIEEPISNADPVIPITNDDESYVPVSQQLGYIPDYTDLYGPPANDWVAYNAGV
jgi:hypothetical protein